MLIKCYSCNELLPKAAFYSTATQCKDCLNRKRQAYRQRVGTAAIKERQRKASKKYRDNLKKKRAGA